MTTPTTDLLDVVARAKKRADVVQPYRDAIHMANVGVVIEWRTVNEAILAKWSKAGLTWIKTQAWS